MDKRRRSSSSEPWRRSQVQVLLDRALLSSTFSSTSEPATEPGLSLYQNLIAHSQLLTHLHSPLINLDQPHSPTDLHLRSITYNNHNQWELNPSHGVSQIQLLLLTFSRFLYGCGMWVWVWVCVCEICVCDVLCVCFLCVCVVCCVFIYACIYAYECP